MGWLDSAKRLTQDLRTGLTQGNATGATVAAPSSGGVDTSQLASAAARSNVPGPLSLLSASTVTQAVGAPVELSNAGAGPDQVTAWWSSSTGWNVWVKVLVPPETAGGPVATPEWAARYVETARSQPDYPFEPISLDGAEEAWWTLQEDEEPVRSILLRRRHVVVDVGASRPGADTRSAIETVAGAVAASLARLVV